MATDKTPTHKRIKRAETGRDDWKMKALERREENAKLKAHLKTQEAYLIEVTVRAKQLEEKLGDQYRLIVKLHPHIQFLIGTQEDTSFVRWCRKDESLNNLILEADIFLYDMYSVSFQDLWT